MVNKLLDNSNNYEYVLDAVRLNGSSLRYASDELKNNEIIVSAACSQNGRALKYASEELQNNEKVAMIAIKRHPHSLQYASEKIRDNKEIVLLALKEGDGQCLVYASKQLKNHDRDVVLAAVQTYEGALSLTSDTFKNDHDIVLAAVNFHWGVFRYVSEKIRNDFEIVITAVRQNKKALQFASEQLRNNVRIVKEAVQSDWGALQYASDNLKDDYDIVLAAVKQHYGAIVFASKRLTQNYEIAVAAVTNHWYAYEYIDTKFKNDKYILLLAAKQSYKILDRSVNACLDREVVIQAMKQSNCAFHKVSEVLKNDNEILMLVYSYDNYSNLKMNDGWYKKTRKYVKNLLKTKYSTTFSSYIYFLCALSKSINNNEPKKNKSIESSSCLRIDSETSSKRPKINILHKLNKMDKWTFAWLKREIGEYAGVQYGEDWNYVLKAAVNFNLIYDYSLKFEPIHEPVETITVA